MLELRFPPQHRVNEQHLAKVREVIAHALDAQKRLGNRAGNHVIFDNIRLNIWDVLDEGYCREALDYHLGLLYSHVGDPEAAALHFQRSGSYPASGDRRLFSDHQRESLDLRRRQETAIERGIPALVIASMARSASASLIQTLSAALDIPIMRVSCGRYLVPRWVNEFSRGGAVLHDHFRALPFNLKTLREAGISDVFVRIRDPRAAAVSDLVRRDQNMGTPDDSDFESRALLACAETYIPWASEWICAAGADNGLPIHLLAQPVRSIHEAVRQVLLTLSPKYSALEQHLSSGYAEITANFVTGDENAWRRRISKSGQDTLWNAMPQSVKDALGLKR